MDSPVDGNDRLSVRVEWTAQILLSVYGCAYISHLSACVRFLSSPLPSLYSLSASRRYCIQFTQEWKKEEEKRCCRGRGSELRWRGPQASRRSPSIWMPAPPMPSRPIAVSQSDRDTRPSPTAGISSCQPWPRGGLAAGTRLIFSRLSVSCALAPSASAASYPAATSTCIGAYQECCLSTST